ncbi:MAG: PVC-type heme-binding CxxCH protein [Chthoniobacter sp.]|uniref:PVC-type heme-binding CxxCH protein n=1 Tax=Chthoniobacter sp. TaxID=2510640 RepID=UPI0032A50E7D
MKRLFAFLPLFLFFSLAFAQADPLRVFIRGGKKTHGPNAHEHERFLNDWKVLLAQRGMKADGAMDFPTADQLAQTDVLVMYAQDAGNITPEQRPILETFIKRGGGIVVIHTASVANKPDTSPYWKSIIGGSWVQGQTKWKEGPMDLYYVENERIGGGHPITKDAANFHLDDEIYYDMDISPDVRVLATAYTPNVKEGKKAADGGKANIYDIQPQMWTYERTAEGGTKPYRAFVTIPGHLYSTFELPQYRAILLRGIAWAAHHENLDEYCHKEELAALTYPVGGPSRPADELAKLEVHPDFRMTLVASEPLITKPICIDWDPAGRLWVAESPEYPNGRRGMRPDYRGKEWKDHGGIDPDPGQQERKGLDKISILTSSKGDGVMDTKQVFYEGLELVTGFVFYQDGVIVTQAPDILFIHNPGPDGKARKVEKLYTGLGTRDTHAVINNPRWGWDGWIYATHGYSSSQNVTTGDGSEGFGTIGSGVVRFKPDGSAIEQYSSKGGNTWGLQITGDNRVMWTQPTSGQLLMQTLLPESTLARGKIGNTPSFNVVIKSDKTFPAMDWDQIAYKQIDFVGSFTAAAGCAIYDGGSWPAEWNGSYFCTEPTINIVHQRFLDPQGSSYTAHKQPGREETEFIRSKDMWFRPIEARIGPDGALYVLDFYNQAVIHNDTRGPDHNNVNAAVRPDRDHYFGRIWRVDHKDAKKLAVPDLSKAKPAELVKALESPNRVVRMTAHRLLQERPEPSATTIGASGKLSNEENRANLNAGETVLQARANQAYGTSALERLIGDTKASTDARVAALWTYAVTWPLSEEPFTLAQNDKDPVLRRNAAQTRDVCFSFARGEALIKAVGDPDATVRLAVLRALGEGLIQHDSDGVAHDKNRAVAEAVVRSWSKFDDDFQRSAAIGVAAHDPAAAISLALESAEAPALTPLVNALTQNIDAKAAGKLVAVLADKPASADALKRDILRSLGRSVKDAPAMTPELSGALAKLLGSRSTSGEALPLAAKWDKTGVLKPQVAQLSSELLATLKDSKGAGDFRIDAARSLIGLRGMNPGIIPTIVAQLGGPTDADVQHAFVGVLADTDDPSVGPALAAVYGKLPLQAQVGAFEAVLKRADWTNAFLDAIKAKQIDFAMLGPANAFRLRAHPDKAVAKRASALFDELNPLVKAKKDAIAKLLPIAEQKGDAERGKQLFTTTCTICHNFHGAGAEIGPILTGMGTHGANELLTAIVDPNAEVDPSFVQWNIETKDGQAYAGVIAAENPASITLKSLAGVQQVKTADIKSRVNTGRSLMPEGFDGLGGEALRDIITYLQSVDGAHFRTLDLRNAFTASTSGGLYNSQAGTKDTFDFIKTGTVTVEGVPFSIVSPEKVVGGGNIVVLEGGPEKAFSKTLPQKVEIKVGGFKANRLHFLGGVTGWGFNGGGDTSDVLTVTIHTTQGQRETLLCKNGVEFADYIRRIDVPGSKYAEGIVKNHQMRWFTKQLSGPIDIDRVTLESPDGHAAPTIVAITAELADANAPQTTSVAPASKVGSGTLILTPDSVAAALKAEDANFKPQFDDAVPQPPATRPANGPRVLIVGGGSSHDFVKFFGGTDKATLAPGAGWVNFTQNANGVPAILDRVDVLVWSANQPVSSATCKALLDFADSGKGIVALHPGTWYAWKNFPAWNAQIIGGGTRGHDKLGPYTVKITNPNSPITKGVTPSFEITDELYNYNADPAATPIEVLAEATSPNTGKTFPQVFIVKHPKSRIVGITLGHDARAHDLPEFQTLLKNAVNWAGSK